jgi:hypothetical protein
VDLISDELRRCLDTNPTRALPGDALAGQALAGQALAGPPATEPDQSGAS